MRLAPPIALLPLLLSMLSSLLLSSLVLSPIAAADAVDPCPPGFSPSHSGCHFGPSEDDAFLCGGCACVFVGLGTVSALLLLFRKQRESGPREGPPPSR